MPGTKLQEHTGSEKAWVYSTVDFADEEQKPELFCIRFASVERASPDPFLCSISAFSSQLPHISCLSLAALSLDTLGRSASVASSDTMGHCQAAMLLENAHCHVSIEARFA
jgi:hypothetical protein